MCSKLFENFGPNCLVYLSLIIFFTSIIGLENSHNQIQYTKEDRYKLTFYVKKKYLQSFFMDDEDAAQIVAEDWVQGNVKS